MYQKKLRSSRSGYKKYAMVEEFVGRIVAIIHREDDVEEKLVVAPENVSFTRDEIMEQVRFQEQYFKSKIVM